MHIAIKILIGIAAYLVGSINFATVISSLKNKDIRKLGSGNPGTMNVMRSVGKWWGVLTFILDAVKGIAFALIGRFLIDGIDNYLMAIIFGFIVVIGHIFPIFSRFKGGKGVATSIGVYMAISPIAGAITLVVLIIFLLVIKYGFLGSFLTITTFVIHGCIMLKDSPLAIVILCVWWALIIFAHRSNIVRLIQGKENTLNIVGKNEVKEINNSGEEEN